MLSPRNNLLLLLHKWAHRHDENFLTEAFAHLVQHLLDEEPEAAVGFLESVTGGFLRVEPADARQVALRTQVVLSEGRPDLEIRTVEHLIYVEIKSESAADGGQVSRYRRLLTESGVPSTALVLLTRYPASLPEAGEQPDAAIRWYEVADWLERESSRYRFKPVSVYLVNQFLEFLGARNMVMGQVTYELFGGVRALRSFVDMLSEAAAACNMSAFEGAGRNWMGVFLDRRAYWMGIRYDRPEILVFETHNREVDPNAASRLGVEGVYEWTSEPGHGWRRELDLQSEEAHFAVRSKARQMQLLEEFLRGCLDTVKRIELLNQRETGDNDIPAESGEDGPQAGPPAN